MNGRSHARRFRLGVTALSMLAIGFAFHCGTETRNPFFVEGWCDSVYGSECGKTCADDTGCANGMFCGADRRCTAECAAAVACSAGLTCSAHGRCEVASGPPGPPVNFGDSGPTDVHDAAPQPDSCADVDVTLDKVTPTVLLLIDQSQSMKDYQFPANSGVTRWDALRSALIAPNDGIVKKLENDVSFGVSLYSWEDQPMDPQCPMLVNIPWKTGNYTDIYNVYADAGVSDNTPTAESIMSVVGFNDAGALNGSGFAAATTPGPKILVLATDGDPDICADRDSNGQQGPRKYTVWATQRTYSAGIPTYVISVGTDIDEAHQQEVANVGQGLAPNEPDAAPVYRPTNKQQLVDALNKIILGVRSCTFKVNGSIVAGTETKGSVTLNGAPLAFDDPNGWKLDSPTEIEFVGNACKTLQTPFDAQVSVRFPCGAIIPPPDPK